MSNQQSSRETTSTPAPNRLRALAATARVANIPSVISNTFLGVAVAYVYNGRFTSSADLIPIFLCPILLYIAGNFWNDWSDQDWDRNHRPERALPSGIFKPITYLLTVCLLVIAGLACALALGAVTFGIATAITISIFVYTWFHKKTPWAVIPMGLCRGFLPILGFSAFASYWQPSSLFGSVTTSLLLVSISAVSLFCYILGLSLSARTESLAQPSKAYLILSRLLFLPAPTLPILLASFIAIISPSLFLIGILPYTVWVLLCLTKFRTPVPKHVSNLLAGIPFIDWIILLPIGIAGIQWSNPFGYFCILIPPLAVISGKALQRYAPAT